MIKPAVLYEEELTKKLRETWYDEKYKYYHFGNFFTDFDIVKDTFNNHQFVSVDKNNNILGYFSYSVDRVAYNANEFGIVAFEDYSLTFGKDLHQVFDDIFMKYNFNKVTFFCVVGNPIMPYYIKKINKLGGRYIGEYKNHVKLMDGKIYDVALFELLKEDYRKNLRL